MAWSKEKRREYNREYRAKNRERINEYHRTRYYFDDEFREKALARRRAVRERIGKEYYSEYRRKNKEKVREHRRTYYQRHKAKLLEYQRGYYQRNKDRLKLKECGGSNGME
jgi:hypothetical protein